MIKFTFKLIQISLVLLMILLSAKTNILFCSTKGKISLSWKKKKNSQQYLVEIAKTNQFNKIIKSVQTKKIKIRVQLSEGNFYIRVTGFGKYNLKRYPIKIVYVQIDNQGNVKVASFFGGTDLQQKESNRFLAQLETAKERIDRQKKEVDNLVNEKEAFLRKVDQLSGVGETIAKGPLKNRKHLRQQVEKQNNAILQLNKEIAGMSRGIATRQDLSEKEVSQVGQIKETINEQNNNINQLKADIAAFKKRLEKAVEIKKTVGKKTQRSDFLRKGNEFYTAEDYIRAKVLYELALKENNDDITVIYKLGVIALIEKRYHDGAEYFKNAIAKLSPQNKKFKVKSLYNLGMCQKKLKVYNKALKSFKAVVNLDPNHIKGIIQIGQTYYKLKRYNQAVLVLTRGLKKSPNHFHILFNLAKAYHSQNKIQKAYDYYVKAIKTKPKNFIALYNLGLLLFQIQKWKEADIIFKRAYAENPKDISLLLQYGKTKLILKKYGVALKVLNQGKNISPNSVAFYILLANGYYEKKEYDHVLTNLNQLIVLGRKSAPIFKKMGDASFQLKKYDEAILQYSWGLKLSSKSLSLHDRLAKTFFKHKKFDNAVKEYLWLIQKKKNEPLYYQKLGEAYLGINDTFHAKIVFKTMLKHFPQYNAKTKIKEYLKSLTKK